MALALDTRGPVTRLSIPGPFQTISPIFKTSLVIRIVWTSAMILHTAGRLINKECLMTLSVKDISITTITLRLFRYLVVAGNGSWPEVLLLVILPTRRRM
jgi:hypothetical protein